MNSIAPTQRMIALSFFLLGLSLFPIFFGDAFAYLWVGAWAVLLIFSGVDILTSVLLPEVRIELDAVQSFYLGEPAFFKIKIDTESKLEYELKLDISGDLKPIRSKSFRTEGGVHVSKYQVQPTRRGTLVASKIWMKWRTRLGLFERIKIVQVVANVLVIPNVEAVKRAALQWQQRSEFMAGVHHQKFLAEGSDFDRLRKYVQGMDHRKIDWKASAKHALLLSRSYQAERNQRLVLAFDTGRLNSEPLGDIPRLDHAINAGLLLGYMSLKIGDQVGLIGFDASVHTFRKPVSGVKAYHYLTAASSKLNYGESEANYTVALSEIIRRVKRRSIVVIFTEFTDTIGAELMLENVARLAKKHVVLFVALRNPELDQYVETPPHNLNAMTENVVVRKLIQERKKVLKELHSRGVYVVDCTPNNLSISLLNRYLELHQRELI